MTAGTVVRDLSWRRLDIPLTEPFGIATGALPVARNVLVRVTLADGTVGLGEAAPFPAVTGETQEDVLAALDAASGLVGSDAAEWRNLGTELRAGIGEPSSAICAVETALIDALTRSRGEPMWSYFGGAEQRLVTDMTITTGDVEQARRAADSIRRRGIETIKIKIGGGEPTLDLERIVAAHEVAPSRPILLDGNCGYDADGSLHLLDRLQERSVPIALFEQPVGKDDLDGMARVAREGGVPVAADESVQTADDVRKITAAKAAQYINIKLMKSGIGEGLDVARAARDAGLGLMIGGMIESWIGMSTAACFAAGLGEFAFVDLDTPLFLDDNGVRPSITLRGDELDLSPIRAGHGASFSDRS